MDRSSEKMGETRADLASSVGLEVSISSIRLETGTLSWENFCLSPNKYLQEVEKCATPGSVAQKKAYFEAHHKNINAARKMEMPIDQENQVGVFGRIRSARADSRNSIDDRDGAGCLTDLSEIPNSSERAIDNEDASGEICTDPDGMKEGKEESKPGNCPEGNSLQEQEEEQEVPKGSLELLEELKKDSETEPRVSLNRSNGHCNLNLQKTPKTNPNKDDSRSAARNRPGGSTMTRPTASKSPVGSGSMVSLNMSKSTAERGQKRTVFPRSLHMSMRLEGAQKSTTPSVSVNQMRKSLIMESIGDKDIVKRMLRSPRSSLQEGSRLHRPAPSVTMDPKASASVVNRKESASASGRAGAAVRRPSPSAGMPSLGSGCSNEREGKTKEPLQKKLGEKSTRKLGGMRSQKSKDEKDAGNDKQRKNLNFKATPLPSFYRESSKQKNIIRQEGYKSEIHQ
ncbi:hypothetical protein SAY87_001693 [Trapa incisa]|uniref:Uncharacterized protein n=1 Tax=Trapa incisa TaxID=236973 RepID=A0AAN7PTL4_9MYRT|nr:hypothetical protein SAY87_001693 [Trapa incisa]